MSVVVVVSVVLVEVVYLRSKVYSVPVKSEVEFPLVVCRVECVIGFDLVKVS